MRFSTAQKTLAIGTHYWRLFAQTSAVNIDPDLANEEIDLDEILAELDAELSEEKDELKEAKDEA